MSLRATIGAGVASGLLLWAAAPPVGLAFLAWVALVPAAIVALRAPASRAGRLAVPLAYAVFLELLLVPALPFGLAENQWGDPLAPILVGGSPVVFVAVLVVPLAALVLYALRFPQPLPLVRLSPRSASIAAVLVPPIAWTALDVVRTKFDPGGFWGPLYLSQHDAAPGHLATLAGPWLVTFALVAGNYAVALALVRAPRRPALAAAAIPLALAAPLAGRIAEPSGARMSVAAVQPGYDTAEFGRPVLHYLRKAHRDLERASLDLVADLAPLTREAARRGAEVAVWPEATVWVEPSENVAVRSALARLARETGLVLVVPYFLRSEAHGASVAVLPDGSLSDPQPKQRPMWFLGEEGADRGPPAPATTGVARIGSLLGVDGQDPALSRALAVRGADVLAASTHDWRALAEEQRAFGQLHARALAVPFIRADWRYGSAIFDSNGRKVADAGLEKRRLVLVADVQPGDGGTAYAKVGDVLGWACLAALAALLLAGRRLRSDAEGAKAERSSHAFSER